MASIHEAILNSDVDFEGAIQNAYEIESSGLDVDIFKDEKLDSLVGVPFLIVAGTYRERFADDKLSDFVTMLAIIADENTLAKRHVRVRGDEPWFPMQTIGINDGSTGIRRQLTAILHAQGAIRVIEEGSVLVESGGRGEVSYDRLVSQWDDWSGGEHTIKVDKNSGRELSTFDFALENGIYCPRGIRLSTYKNKYGKMTTTRYLA